MKNQNPNKLAFNKAVVTELNENQLQHVNGGSLITTVIATIIIDQLLN